MGLIPEVIPVTDLDGGVTEEPLPEAEIPKGWMLPEVMTQVWFGFI